MRAFASQPICFYFRDWKEHRLICGFLGHEGGESNITSDGVSAIEFPRRFEAAQAA